MSQPSNNLISSSPYKINFNDFDKIIEEQLEKCIQYSFKLITEKDIPQLVFGLREWLIKNIGCFTVSGYVTKPILTDWFEYETIIEVFDDLVVSFRDYLKIFKSIDINSHYTLMRYRDNLTFIVIEEPQKLINNSFIPVPILSDITIDVSNRFIQFEKRLELLIGNEFDISGLMKELKGDNFEGLLEKYVINQQE